jgi:nucleoside-triphosphatase THEP1
MFDSQADIAAVAYGPGEDPDGLLRGFAESLSRSGYRAVGLIQASRRSAVAPEALSAVMLPTGAAVSLRHDRRPSAIGCHLDADELAEARMRLAQAIAEGADLVIINRFGKLELAGGGFLAEIRQAVEAEIPVLIAVPRPLFMAWTRFCRGMSVKLACARAPLDAWWRSVSRPAHADRSRPGADFCALAK